MSRIAFVSCVRIPYTDDFDNDPPCKLDVSAFDQPVWDCLLAQHNAKSFDAILFLGDQIYSDYGMSNGGGNRPVADNWSPNLFHCLMYTMYKAQYTQVASFKQFMQRMKDDNVKIGMIWDDHDFGYNNGSGMNPQFQNKLASAKVLFEQFLGTFQTMPSTYPDIPATPPAPVTLPIKGVERIHNSIKVSNKVEIVLLDSRTYRDFTVGQGASLIGAQWTQLKPKMEALTSDQLMIVCLGSTYSVPGKLLFKSSDQSWMQSRTQKPYADFDAFTKLAKQKHVLILSGDIHTNEFVEHDGFCEVISSGAHMPYKFFDNPVSGTNKSRFGLLDIDDSAIKVQLFAKNKIEKNISKTISRATGMPI